MNPSKPAWLRDKQAVLFDMDGVLVDSEPLHEATFARITAELGYPEHGLHFHHYLGKRDEIIWQDFLARFKLPHKLDDLVARRQDAFLEAMQRETTVFPGLRPLLEDLRIRYKLALASGSSRRIVEGMMLAAQLESFFPVRISANDVRHTKPDPECFLKAAAALHVAPEQCVVIEDSMGGVEAAHRADMHAIAITNTLPGEKLAHADVVVDDYEEIRRLLLG